VVSDKTKDQTDMMKLMTDMQKRLSDLQRDVNQLKNEKFRPRKFDNTPRFNYFDLMNISLYVHTCLLSGR
jgi:hypothetical protein